MKNKLILIALALITVVSLNRCSHEDDFFDGPSLVDRFGDFELLDSLELNRTTVDFSAGETVIFTAKFNKRIDFVVEITGTVSGAVKRIEGFESELTEDNARWRGGTTDLPFFREEMCMVKLIIPEEDSLTMTAEVEITGTKTYPGNVFTDFETEPGADIFFGNFEFELTPNTGRKNDGMAAQGDWYYYFEGTDDVVPNYFCGLIDIKSSITGSTYAPIPTTDPTALYLNAFIYADGGPHGSAVIQLIYDSNDSGEFEDGQDAAFEIEGGIPLNWTGWRALSFTAAQYGMTEAQVQKIVAIRVLLISALNAQPDPPLQVDFGIDYLTFTNGAPLEL